MASFRETWWQKRFSAWLDKQSPKAPEQHLHLKNLYIFPTVVGFLFCLLAVLIWLLGTNYQNNLILALAYLQLSLVVVVILHTYSNLAGLSIRFIGCEPNYAGRPVAFNLELYTRNARGCDNLRLRWGKGGEEVAVNLEPRQRKQVTVWMTSTQRGILYPGRLFVSSTYPMGIIRCWTRLNIKAEALVYPAPLRGGLPHGETEGERDDRSHAPISGDDFAGLRVFRPGHSLKRVAWKHFAQDKGLFIKHFEHGVVDERWLDWRDFYRGDTEQALSRLCYWVNQYHSEQRVFGLRLPDEEVAPSLGQAHTHRVLHALACFGY